MRNPDNRAIDDLLFDCCRELFASYGLQVEPRRREEFPAEQDLALCAVMGFGGKQMRGALVLATTRGPIEQTNPIGAGSTRDWICELSNQLMGRVKNRLVPLGVDVHLATPAGLSGENLHPCPRRVRSAQVFAAANGFICVWIDVEQAEGFELALTRDPVDDAPVSEGQTLIF